MVSIPLRLPLGWQAPLGSAQHQPPPSNNGLQRSPAKWWTGKYTYHHTKHQWYLSSCWVAQSRCWWHPEDGVVLMLVTRRGRHCPGLGDTPRTAYSRMSCPWWCLTALPSLQGLCSALEEKTMQKIVLFSLIFGKLLTAINKSGKETDCIRDLQPSSPQKD